jgi:4-diphosphocytidyl-2-C-methyl-D-erythritol kinase
MALYKAPAKVNIFLKITGKRGEYHTLLSRFMRVDHLYDTLSFIPNPKEGFSIIGNFDCSTDQNTIYKAYRALHDATGSNELVHFMKAYAVKVDKHIPAFAGLGGGSSDAATYLHMCNETLDLGLSVEQLSGIGAKVGADLPFFIHGHPSANVSGIGEIVEAFDEVPLDLEIVTPSIQISTPAVYKKFRSDFYKELAAQERVKMASMSSEEILHHYTLEAANDLFAPALALYPQLQETAQPGWFFSGSGSSFFRPRPS